MIFTIRTESDKNTAIAAIRDMDLSKPKRVTIESHYPKRTHDQNDLYWFLMTEWARLDGNGNTKDDMHEYCLDKFAGKKKVVVGNEIRFINVRSKEMETKSFSEYIERVYAEAAGFGIILPTPEDLRWASYEANDSFSAMDS